MSELEEKILFVERRFDESCNDEKDMFEYYKTKCGRR